MSKLTERQAKVLRAYQLDARAPVSRIATLTGLREHAVRYALEEMLERKLIRPFALVNIHKLGYLDFCLFFNRSTDTSTTNKEIARVLRQSEQVAWFASLGGRFQYTASIFAKDVSEIDSILRKLGADCRGAICDKTFAIRESWTSYPAKYLSLQGKGISSLVRAQAKEASAFSTLDMQIVRAVVQEPLASNAMLARKLQIPATTFAYRLQKLEQAGVVAGYMFFLSTSLIGRHLFRLLLFVKSSRPGFATALTRYCERHPDITGLVHCIGNWDYEVNVEVKDLQHIEEIVDDLSSTFSGDLRGVETLSVLETSKICLYPF